MGAEHFQLRNDEPKNEKTPLESSVVLEFAFILLEASAPPLLGQVFGKPPLLPGCFAVVDRALYFVVAETTEMFHRQRR